MAEPSTSLDPHALESTAALTSQAINPLSQKRPLSDGGPSVPRRSKRRKGANSSSSGLVSTTSVSRASLPSNAPDSTAAPISRATNSISQKRGKRPPSGDGGPSVLPQSKRRKAANSSSSGLTSTTSVSQTSPPFNAPATSFWRTANSPTHWPHVIGSVPNQVHATPPYGSISMSDHLSVLPHKLPFATDKDAPLGLGPSTHITTPHPQAQDARIHRPWLASPNIFSGASADPLTTIPGPSPAYPSALAVQRQLPPASANCQISPGVSLHAPKQPRWWVSILEEPSWKKEIVKYGKAVLKVLGELTGVHSVDSFVQEMEVSTVVVIKQPYSLASSELARAGKPLKFVAPTSCNQSSH